MNSLELSWTVSHHFVLFSFALDEGREKKKRFYKYVSFLPLLFLQNKHAVSYL